MRRTEVSENLHPATSAKPRHVPTFTLNGLPPAPTSRRGGFGLLTRTLLSSDSGDGGLSPNSNSLRNMMNPLRSKLGLEPFKHLTPVDCPSLPSSELDEPEKSNTNDDDLGKPEELNTNSGDLKKSEKPNTNSGDLKKPEQRNTNAGELKRPKKPIPLPAPPSFRPTSPIKSEPKPKPEPLESDATRIIENPYSGDKFTWVAPPPPTSLYQTGAYSNSTQVTHVIEVPRSSSNVSTELCLGNIKPENEQNVDPKSGPVRPNAIVFKVSQKPMGRSTSCAAVLNSAVAESAASVSGNIKTKNCTGPLQNHLVNEQGTPILRPPLPMSASGKKAPGKRSGSNGNKWRFSNDTVQGKEYLILKELGKGGCGQVFLVMEKESRELFAMKKVNLAGLDQNSIQECINEVHMLMDLKDSELVIHIDNWERSETENTLKIVMEYGHCDLNKSILTSRVSFSKLKFIWERLLQIIEVIHGRGIVHADLKPANFVWVADNLKIIDFGIANRLQSDLTSIPTMNPKGTLNFISPETIRPDVYGRTKIGPKSDIWSLGCILYMMVYGKTPFQDITHNVAKMGAIMTAQITYPPLPPQLESSSVISVLKLCFELDSRKRPTASDLLKHPFFYESSIEGRKKNSS